jgi:hypothetical protein
MKYPLARQHGTETPLALLNLLQRDRTSRRRSGYHGRLETAIGQQEARNP